MQSLTWEATYNDGTVVTEADVETTALVDRDRLAQFKLLNNEGRAVFVSFFSSEKKLIFRRRTFISPDGSVKGVVYLIGWHQNVNGKSVKSICYVYEDGHVEFDDARNDLELFPFEEFGKE